MPSRSVGVTVESVAPEVPVFALAPPLSEITPEKVEEGLPLFVEAV